MKRSFSFGVLVLMTMLFAGEALAQPTIIYCVGNAHYKGANNSGAAFTLPKWQYYKLDHAIFEIWNDHSFDWSVNDCNVNHTVCELSEDKFIYYSRGIDPGDGKASEMNVFIDRRSGLIHDNFLGDDGSYVDFNAKCNVSADPRTTGANKF